MWSIPFVAAAAFALLLASCSRAGGDDVSRTTLTAGSVPALEPQTSESMSERDRSGAPSPEDPSLDPADVALAKDIRDALTADDSLSLYAKTVDIAVRDGKVTLQGGVPNKREHDIVLQKARELAGIAWVDDRLAIRGRP